MQINLKLKNYKLVNAEKALYQQIYKDFQFITPSELASKLGVSERTVYRKCKEFNIHLITRNERKIINKAKKLIA